MMRRMMSHAGFPVGRKMGAAALVGVIALATLSSSMGQPVPATQPDPEDRSEPDRVWKLDEALGRFERDERLSLCHVWETGDGTLAGFVEQPQYRSVLARLTKRDVSKVKLLPEESKTSDRFGIVTAGHALLREGPSDEAGDRDNVSDLVLGEPVWILDRASNGALLVHSSDGYLGWVSGEVIQPIGATAMKSALVRTRSPVNVAKVESALDVARAHLGTPYLWGGKTNAGIDCSGLVQICLERVGVLLPRDADQQSNVGKLVATRWFKDALLPGDLLFFVSPRRGNVHHVAIYLGESKYIHASGKDVHIGSFDPKDAEYDAERAETFAWARRVIE